MDYLIAQCCVNGLGCKIANNVVQPSNCKNNMTIVSNRNISKGNGSDVHCQLKLMKRPSIEKAINRRN